MHVFLVYECYNHIVIIMQTLKSSELISSIDDVNESPHEVLRTVNPYKLIFSANLKTFGRPLQKIVHNTNNSELYDNSKPYSVTSQGYSYVPKSKFLVKSSGSSLTEFQEGLVCPNFNYSDFLDKTQSFYVDPANAYKMSWITGGTTLKDTGGYISINDKVYVGYSPEKTIVSALVKTGSNDINVNSMFDHGKIIKNVDAKYNIPLTCSSKSGIFKKIHYNLGKTNLMHENTLLMTMMDGKSLFFGTPNSDLKEKIDIWINDLDSNDDSNDDSNEIINISSNNFVVDQNAKIIQGINVVLDDNANVLCCLTTLATGEIESDGSTNEIISKSETKTIVLPVDNKIGSGDRGNNNNSNDDGINYSGTPVSYDSVDPSKVSMYTVLYPTNTSGFGNISPLDDTLLFSKNYTMSSVTSDNINKLDNEKQQQYKYFVFNYTAPATVLLDSHILHVFNRSVDLAISGLDNYGLIYIQFDFKIMDKSIVKTTVTLKARKINYSVEYIKEQGSNIIQTGDFKKDNKPRPYLPSDYLKDIATNAPLKGYSVYNKVDEAHETSLKKMYRPVGLYKENKYYEGHNDTANTNVKSANIIQEGGFINIDCKDRAIYKIDGELKSGGKVNYQCGTKPVNNLTRHVSVAYSGYYPGAYDPTKASTLNKKTDNGVITDASADAYFMPLERRNTLTFKCPDNKVLTSLFTFDKLKHGLIEHRTEYTCGTYL